MTSSMDKAVRAAIALMLFTAAPVRAEYLRIQLRVFGLDCELCARGVSATVRKMDGVESVNISLKTGLLQVVLTRGNKFSMSALRKRIRENGFRPMDAIVDAYGRFNGTKFEVLGSGESYDLGRKAVSSDALMELTFNIP